MLEAFGVLVDARTARMDYSAFYAATVKSQSGDLSTVGVVFDDSRWPPMDGLPLKGYATLKVAPGARVLVGFENQDPSRPRAMLWETGNLLEVHLDPSMATVFNGGTAQVGRVGDLVAANTSMLAWITAVTSAVTALDPTLVAPTDFGKISSGAPKVKA